MVDIFLIHEHVGHHTCPCLYMPLHIIKKKNAWNGPFARDHTRFTSSKNWVLHLYFLYVVASLKTPL